MKKRAPSLFVINKNTVACSKPLDTAQKRQMLHPSIAPPHSARIRRKSVAYIMQIRARYKSDPNSKSPLLRNPLPPRIRSYRHNNYSALDTTRHAKHPTCTSQPGLITGHSGVKVFTAVCRVEYVHTVCSSQQCDELVSHIYIYISLYIYISHIYWYCISFFLRQIKHLFILYLYPSLKGVRFK